MATLECAFALQRVEVIKRSPRGHLEALTDLTHRRGKAVLLTEASDEPKDLRLPFRELSHVPSFLELNKTLANTC
jgi:hypothetical protein